MEELIKRIDKLEERIYALEHKSTCISLPEDFFGGEMNPLQEKLIQMILTNKQEEGLKLAVARYRNGEKYTVIAGYA